MSTWTLNSVERGVSGEKPERIQNARGLLIFDSVGHAFEFFTTASRQAPETPQVDPLAMFNAYGGFWGGYRVAPDQIEFWQGRASRLHDRIVYRLAGEAWIIERLSP